ncbi:DUF262 domain-containing protein [Streptomyces sp. NPDC015140]|uniref:DUF262 domain-containing protein n=1 Tax=Streptomyces sp. NPDC015140 TaxID=3364943 RepID=UPI0036FB5E2F
MKTTATNKRIRELLTAITNNTLIPQPEFQRRLVWTNRHKQEFIKTVLEGLPFPEIFLCDGDTDLQTGIGTQQIVDGQQRITTLYQYFRASPDFRLGDLTAYSDLGETTQHSFLNYEVVVRDLGQLTIQQVRNVFYRMNSTNYGLNTMEVNNARFDGALKRAAEEVSSWPFFDEHRTFTAADYRRMGDVRWCLTVLITVISGYFSRDVEHEKFLRQYNDEFPLRDQSLAKLQAAVSLLESLELERDSRAWQKNDLFTLLVEIVRMGSENCHDPAGLAESLNLFYASVNLVAKGEYPSGEFGSAATSYHTDVISGSNERARRARRGEIIHKLCAPYFEGEAT